MPKRSAGILLFRYNNNLMEVFLVHPGGPFWANKDLGSWSIAKGEYEENENAFEVAKREFKEETGYTVDGEFIALGEIKQPSGKVVTAWALEGNCDARSIKSNTFSIEWPPKSGRMQEFPEVDRAEWFIIDSAMGKILKGQKGFLEKLMLIFPKRKQEPVEKSIEPPQHTKEKPIKPIQLSLFDSSFFKKR
ncbi:MAG: NUDIX domain-containing protein [Deltaproteobacteria bacterium]|nr:NUDIX domain-containing protein [Deltaproteobacteria bacterium]